MAKTSKKQDSINHILIPAAQNCHGRTNAQVLNCIVEEYLDSIVV